MPSYDNDKVPDWQEWASVICSLISVTCVFYLLTLHTVRLFSDFCTKERKAISHLIVGNNTSAESSQADNIDADAPETGIVNSQSRLFMGIFTLFAMIFFFMADIYVFMVCLYTESNIRIYDDIYRCLHFHSPQRRVLVL